MDNEPYETACDVLVVGAGIAGTIAALEAARAGARTTLASLGPPFSGSSFYPGTWGLGLIAPIDETDAQDLERTILRVGCGMASPTLVRTLVLGIRPAIERLERLGAELKRPNRADEREFVPCFDHKGRLWRGILREPCERALAQALEDAGVRAMSGWELMDLDAPAKGGVRGATLYDHGRATSLHVACRAVVIACGGVGGLFERRLTGSDVVGSAQAIALMHGARLANVEFLQIMPGFVSPCTGVVFNEKAFRFMELKDADAARQLTDRADCAQLLAQRSGYGPFTSRLASRAVDAAIDAAGPDGLAMRYRIAGADDDAPMGAVAMPKLVRDYYAWLERDFGMSPHAWACVAPYAHAANGGLLVDKNAATDVPGLFACGEATGGMHGADRIGGLSSANGLVFGAIAGKSAARWALAEAASNRSARRPTSKTPLKPESSLGAQRAEDSSAGSRALDSEIQALRRRLQRTMSAHCMIARTEEGLAQAASELQAIGVRADERLACEGASADALRLRHQAVTARCLVEAMRQRRESRGAHFRADFPSQDPAFDRPFAVSWDATAGEARCEPLSW